MAALAPKLTEDCPATARETVPITVTIERVERISAGSLRALLSLRLEVLGCCDIRVNGVQVRCTDDGSWQLGSPRYKTATGEWRPAMELDQEVWNQTLEMLSELISADPSVWIP